MVVPHGVHPAHPPGDDRRAGDRFVFYNTLRRLVAERKGYRELIRCFQSAFQGRDDVVLRLRVGDHRWLPACPGWPDYGGLVEFDPPGALSMQDAAAVYSEVHCTVHPTKGEGFGLVPLESIACETPVIAPAHTGMVDYLAGENGILLRPGERIHAPRVDHQCGCYYSVDEEHLVELLRHAHMHWPEERKKLKLAAERVRTEYDWSRVLSPFIEIVKAGLDCGDSWEFTRVTSKFSDPVEREHFFAEAERRARARVERSGPASGAAGLGFSNIIYCGWDYPRDGVGNHLRLLDRLIFNEPGIRYKSLDELPAVYHPQPYTIESYVHEQRPDLFGSGLYLDVVGFHGDEGTLRRQIERVADIKQRFDAKTAIYLMWESTRLWAPLLKLVKAYDLVIVTTSLLDDYLRQRGVPYVRLPHPYAYEVARPSAGDAGNGVLTMGISAGLWPRKNLALVAETFAEVLGGHAGFRLRLHTRTKPMGKAASQEHQRIERAAAGVDNIEYRVESFSRPEYLAWLQSLDLYCFLSSGEGWSVTPREALHLGKPVVLLDAHAHAGFSHLPGVIRVAPGPPSPARPGVDFIQSDIGLEASVDLASFRRVLGNLRELYREARSGLAAGFDDVLAHHDVESMKTQWLSTMSSLFS
jgi:glycosyltransferase involved in cell wall biosynthesis